MTIGERLRLRRKALAMSAEQLAASVGINPATLYRIENGEIEGTSIERAARIADALGITLDELCGHTLPQTGGDADGGDRGDADRAARRGSGADHGRLLPESDDGGSGETPRGGAAGDHPGAGGGGETRGGGQMELIIRGSAEDIERIMTRLAAIGAATVAAGTEPEEPWPEEPAAEDDGRELCVTRYRAEDLERNDELILAGYDLGEVRQAALDYAARMDGDCDVRIEAETAFKDGHLRFQRLGEAARWSDDYPERFDDMVAEADPSRVRLENPATFDPFRGMDPCA